MKMILQRQIDAPPSRVFEVFTDLDRLEEVVPEIVKTETLTDGPLGVGSRIRSTRKMFGKEASEEMEFVAFDPPTGYQLEARSHGAHYLTGYRFEPAGGGTLVHFEFTGKAESLMAKLMTPLSMLCAGAMKKMMVREFDALQAECEGRAETQPATAS